MTDISPDWIHGSVELSDSGFSGEYSIPVQSDLTGLVPLGDYEIAQDHLLGGEVKVPTFLREVAAEIELFPTDRGGRASATPEGTWRCSLKVGDRLADCRMYFGEGVSLAPGGATTVRIRFLSPANISLVQDALDFVIWEGRAVGKGTVRIFF